MKRRTILSLVVPGLMLASCCHHHDYVPEDSCLTDGSSAELSVKLRIDGDMSHYTALDLSRDAGVFLTRYTVWAVREGEKSPTQTLVTSDTDVTFHLPIGKYDIIAFADQTPSPALSDHYYHTDIVEELLVRNKYSYPVGDDSKIAWWGHTAAAATIKSAPVTVSLTPAVAGIRLVATDTPAFEAARTRLIYQGNCPAAISGYDGRLTDLRWSGVSFATAPSADLLAKDYIFCSDDEIKVKIDVEITDTKGEVRARKTGLQVPVVRGGVTIVSANFYSTLDPPTGSDTAGSGGGIDPTFTSTTIIQI